MAYMLYVPVLKDILSVMSLHKVRRADLPIHDNSTSLLIYPLLFVTSPIWKILSYTINTETHPRTQAYTRTHTRTHTWSISCLYRSHLFDFIFLHNQSINIKHMNTNSWYINIHVPLWLVPLTASHVWVLTQCPSLTLRGAQKIFNCKHFFIWQSLCYLTIESLFSSIPSFSEYWVFITLRTVLFFNFELCSLWRCWW